MVIFNRPRLVIGIFMAIALSLEIIVPSEYIIGYVYVVPILYADYRINSRWGKWVTVVAVCLMMIYCFDFQHLNIYSLPQAVFFNRILASAALIISHVLCLRVRICSELAASRQAEIVIQASLAALRTDFAATLVHDLKTPLIGAVETILAFNHGDFGAVSQHQEHALAIMTRAHKTSIHQLDTVLEVCHQDYHGLYLDYQTSNLETIATNAIDTLTDMAHNRQIQIDWINKSATTEIECDVDRIDRVFTNLLLNAINQSPPNSSILVCISDESSHYLIRVIDRGRGIKSADLPHIFAKHYQGSIGRRTKGAGLGLYLVRQIIETHGGKIWIEPGIEQGVAFLFTLPKKAETA
jgi:two-component system, NarL family, sensor kinase